MYLATNKRSCKDKVLVHAVTGNEVLHGGQVAAIDSIIEFSHNFLGRFYNNISSSSTTFTFVVVVVGIDAVATFVSSEDETLVTVRVTHLPLLPLVLEEVLGMMKF